VAPIAVMMRGLELLLVGGQSRGHGLCDLPAAHQVARRDCGGSQRSAILCGDGAPL
jgi:hypothetical protein